MDQLTSLFANSSLGLTPFITTLFLVLLAEMGDKTQLLVIGFTTRYKVRQVVIGVISSIIVLNALAVLMGSIITTLIPMTYIQLLAAIAFIIFGIMAFKNGEEEEKAKAYKINPTLAIAAAFFVAELGDKTQLATMAFAAQFRAPVQVFLGAVIAMIIADMLGIVAGVALNKYISPKYLRIVSGVMFIGFGFIGLGSLMPQSRLAPIINSSVIMIGICALIVIMMLVFAVRPNKNK